MAKPYRKGELSFLESSRIAIENAEHPQIAPLLDEYDYNSEERARGLSIYSTAREAFDQKRAEHFEASECYTHFAEAEKTLIKEYKKYRKRAKIAFKREPLSQDSLGINRKVPTVYLVRMEAITNFYTTLLNSDEMLVKISRFKCTEETIQEALDLLKEVKEKRSKYIKERGEAQNATKVKDKALELLQFWMDDFIDVAKLALENHPQLLEIMGIVVPS